MRGIGVDDEALFMHPPVAALWETVGLSGPSFKVLVISDPRLRDT